MRAIVLLLFGILILLIGGPLLLAGVIVLPGYLLWASDFITVMIWTGIIFAFAFVGLVAYEFLKQSKPDLRLTNADGTVSPEYLAEMQRRNEEYKRKNGLS